MFCCELVPLLWFEKAVYNTEESFSAEFGIANYYSDLNNALIKWKIMSNAGLTVMVDSTRIGEILKGSTSKLGDFSIPLAGLPAPAKYTIELSLPGTTYKNQWNIWVYQKNVKIPDNGIIVTNSFKDAIDALKDGRKVLLNPDPGDIAGITGKFVPVFWSPVHFPDQPGTMGLLIDPLHPAFRDFPTDFYSNWQWWDLCKNSTTINLDSLSVDPIVKVIDNFFKNRKLGNIFEAKVGPGMLVFSSVDIHSDLKNRPVARQLKISLLKYMNSSDFNPRTSITPEEVFSLSSVGKNN